MKISSDEFNDLIMVIKRRIGVDKRNGKTIKYEDIDSYIDKGLEFIPISLTDEDRAEVFRAIETEEAIKHTKGNCIFDDYDDPQIGMSMQKSKMSISGGCTANIFWKNHRLMTRV